MLGILYHGTKLEANARNSILNHSAEEKTTRNSVPWNKNISKDLKILFRTIPRKRQQLGIPFRSMSRTKTCCQFCLLEQDFFYIIFFMQFPSVPSFGIDSFVNFGMPGNDPFPGRTEAVPSLIRGIFSERNSAANGMSTFFRGITEAVSSLFRGIFCGNEIPLPTLLQGRRLRLRRRQRQGDAKRPSALRREGEVVGSGGVQWAAAGPALPPLGGGARLQHVHLWRLLRGHPLQL
jgi:hypothetical protein